jgi:integrase
MTEATLHRVCEGAVVFYKRDGSNTECWYARFKNPKTGKWKKFSTKETDLEKAKLVAQRQYDVRSELIRNNIDIDSKRFSYVADYVIKQLQADIDAGTGKKTFEDYIRVIKRFKEFFGAKYIGNITYQDLVEYDRERTRRLGHKAKQSTINLANVALARVFRVAIEKGWMHQSQSIAFRNDGTRGERRPYSELHEYRKVYRFMRQYVKLTTKDSPRGGVKRQSLLIRELMRDYVLFLANTGLRHGTETKNLMWKHISETTINGKKFLLIKLDKGKTGKRTIVCRHSARKYLKRIKDRFPPLRQRELGEMLDVNEAMFRCRDGSVPKDFHGAFKNLLEKANLLCDVNGAPRSLYSLRHTYATFQIIYNKVDLHTLSKNMGTSVAMLERHYSHLEVLHRADTLAGRSESTSERAQSRQTRIVELEETVDSFESRRSFEPGTLSPLGSGKTQ